MRLILQTAQDIPVRLNKAIHAHVRDTENLDERLSFCVLDLNSDEGWDEALKNCAALMHTASPFPMSQPEDDDALIRPAVDGTTRALRAAQTAGVERVILTSSIVAIYNKRLAAGRSRYDETDWSESNSPMATAYSKSKTLAEKAAWAFVREHPEMKLTVINPGLVLGAPLDTKIGTSLKLISRLLAGKDPMVPNLGMAIVDVRDIALMHVRALQRPESSGARFIGAERFMWMKDIAAVLKTEYPDRKIATRLAPDWVIRIMGLFDKTIKGIIPLLGHEMPMDNTAAAEVLGIEFIEARQAIKTSASSLIRENLV